MPKKQPVFGQPIPNVREQLIKKLENQHVVWVYEDNGKYAIEINDLVIRLTDEQVMDILN